MEKKTREEKCLYKWPETRIHDDDEGKNGKNKIHRQTATSQLLFYFARSLRRLVKGVHRWKFLSMFLEPICIFFFYFFTYQQKKGNLCFLFFLFWLLQWCRHPLLLLSLHGFVFFFFLFPFYNFDRTTIICKQELSFFPLARSSKFLFVFFPSHFMNGIFGEEEKLLLSIFTLFCCFFFRLPLPFFFFVLFRYFLVWYCFESRWKMTSSAFFTTTDTHQLFFQPPTTKKRKE